MSKKRTKLHAENVYQHLEKLSRAGLDSAVAEDTPLDLAAVHGMTIQEGCDTSRQPRLRRFRFQLLHQWMIQNFAPCRVADVGGGKGLLAHLLTSSGWQVTVIDPLRQAPPGKYKDIVSGMRVKIDPAQSLPYICSPFEPRLAVGFDLLIAMHAHGCNVKIIDAASQYGCGYILFPCCVIDEPFYPPLGVHWLESLADYALRQGHHITPFRLNFKGQNIGLYGKA